MSREVSIRAQRPEVLGVPRPIGPNRRAWSALGWWADLAALGLVNLCVLGYLPNTALSTAIMATLGWYVLALLPLRLLVAKQIWGPRRPIESWGYSLAALLLVWMIGGLVVNTVLPWLGWQRPLAAGGVVLLLDTVVIGLMCWRRPARTAGGSGSWTVGERRPRSSSDIGVLVLSTLAAVAAVTGAIRLNNEAGGGLALGGLVIGALCWFVILARHHALRPATVMYAIYFLSLGLLLMTSLRGWGITGHDIQREYARFDLLQQAGQWDIAAFRDAYNACLSITILPQIVTVVTGLSPIYFFKIIPQLIFAACPVLIYLIARRFGSGRLATLSALIFVTFPTYFSDMPFLARQEVAFFFLGVCFLVAVDEDLPVRLRRRLFALFSSGVVVSHYSTTYVLLAVLLAAVGLRLVWSLLDRRRRQPGAHSSTEFRWRIRLAEPVIGVGNTLLLLVLTFGWSQAITQTNGQLFVTVSQSVRQVISPSAVEAKSSDTRYNLFGGVDVSPEQRLSDYRERSVQETGQQRAAGEYLPLSIVQRAPTPAALEAQVPVTPLGRFIDDIGPAPSSVHTALRWTVARALQVFIVIGLLACFLARRRHFRATLEFISLAAASLLAVFAQAVLPQTSIDYGILRSFQQALFIVAPLIAYGMLVACSFARRWAMAAASGVGLGLYLSLTGVLSQATGGYPPQLHLNNRGVYYDIYYYHAEEDQGLSWFQKNVRAKDEAARLETDPFSASRYNRSLTPAPGGDIYPTLLRPRSYVFLGYTTSRERKATLFEQGDLVTYLYPVATLGEVKDVIYANGSVTIYK